MYDIISIIFSLILQGLLEGVIYSLFAIGLTLIFGIMKILNLSHGDIGILGAYISYWLCVLYGFDPIISLALVFPLICIFGFCLQKYLITPAIKDPRLQTTASVMITYGIALLISNLEIVTFGSDYRSLTLPYSFLGFTIGSVQLNFTRLIVLLFTAGIAGILSILLKMRIGKAMRACAQDRDAAMLLGVNFNKIATITFALTSGIAAIAGTLYILTHTLYPAVGLDLTIKGLTVMVFGGLGSVPGAFLGGLILGISESVVSFFIGDIYRELVSFFVLIIVLLIKPTGILGRSV
jgi:branched-chain amino acid transport system permease protein